MTGAEPHQALSWSAWRIVQWGVLWGLLLSAAEFFVIAPLHGLPASGFVVWWLTVWPLPLWCLIGCVFLLLARRAERRGRWRAAVFVGLMLAVAWSAYQPLQVQLMRPYWDYTHVLGPATKSGDASTVIVLPTESLLAYNLWVTLFYGGLLTGGYALSMRSERTRAVLREAALARGRTEALFGEMHLQTLQAQIEPALLLTALDEVQRLYQHDSDRADALLERLVDFLRAAMPGLKGRDSSLQAELHLAKAFARLQTLMPGGARWQVEWPGQLPEREFPGLLLLPIMALAGRQESPSLVVQIEDGQPTLTLQALGRWLPEDIAQRTRSSLQAVFGQRFRMRVDETLQTRLVIELEPSTVPKEPEREPRLS